MRKKYYQFRHLSVDDAVIEGFNAWTGRMAIWLACGIGMGFVHHALLELLGKEPISLLVRVGEALLVSVLPFSVAARAASDYQDESEGPLGSFFNLRSLVTVTLCLFTLFAFGVLGGLAVNGVMRWVFERFWSGGVDSLARTLLSPVGVLSGMTTYPLLVLGGMLVGVRYALAPFAAIHEKRGYWDAFRRSRELGEDLVFGMIFLMGLLFVTVSGTFLIVAILGNEPTLLNRIAESSVFTLAMALVACVWNHAYRQAKAFEEEAAQPTMDHGRTLYLIR